MRTLYGNNRNPGPYRIAGGRRSIDNSRIQCKICNTQTDQMFVFWYFFCEYDSVASYTAGLGLLLEGLEGERETGRATTRRTKRRAQMG